MQSELFRLAPHVVSCTTHGGIVLLDLKRNRYLGLSDAHARAAGAFVAELSRDEARHASDAQASRVLDILLLNGLVVRSVEPDERPFALASLPESWRTCSGTSSSTRATPSVLLKFASACHWSRRSLRQRSLLQIAMEVSDSNSAAEASSTSDQKAIELQCTFQKLRPLAFAARDQCLFHALALWRFLAAFDITATWVIGVRTQPWAAHSWLQRGDVLIDATPESVCSYAPILAV